MSKYQSAAQLMFSHAFIYSTKSPHFLHSQAFLKELLFNFQENIDLEIKKMFLKEYVVSAQVIILYFI